MSPVYIFLAFLADLAVGDPRAIPHPVQAMGKAVSFLEVLLLKLFRGPLPELIAGGFMVAVVSAVSYLIPYGLLYLAKGILPGWGNAVVAVCLAFTTLSVKSLADAGRAVYRPLLSGDLDGARKSLSMVVGRDTVGLEEVEVVRGAVETVAENASDGVVAPLIYLAVGGVPLAFAYKAVNTMDSMVGYRNGRYRYFGRVAARLDDVANYIPARLTALLMVVAAWLLSLARGGFSGGGSLKVLLRDRYRHTSPNSGHPEAAAAGALRVRLGGENSYFGVKSVKPYIGDPDEPLLPGKIRDVVSLMYATSALAMFVACTISYCIYGYG